MRVKQRLIAVVLGGLSVFLAGTTVAYVVAAFDPLNKNGGGFGIVLALVMFGLPAGASAWAALRFCRT